MALPDGTELVKLEYGLSGSPFVAVTAKSSISTLGLEYGLEGSPFVAAEGGSTPPAPEELYIMVIIT